VKKGFIFDINKCVGCHACVVACQIENGKDQNIPWREISTFNEYQHPGLPLFHYSLACNHCQDAPCAESCPAIAYGKNDLGNIVHYANKCIGCKYCTWACPYDAPNFVKANGIVEKCTLCQHRLEEGLKPACANLCPTGALDFDQIEIKPQSRIAGFTEAGVNPRIMIIELRKKKAPENKVRLSQQEESIFNKLQLKSKSKVSLKQEWPLVIFTLMASLLFAYFTSGMFGFVAFSPWLFFGSGIAGMALSSIHLGQKFRAWRSVLNIKNSWLSREILFYTLFLFFAFGWVLKPDIIYIGYLASLLGLASCYAVDKVYSVFEKNTKVEIHSANVFMSALLFTAILTLNEVFIGIILGLKLLLYVYRKSYFLLNQKAINIYLSVPRILFGFILPFIFWGQLNTGVWEFLFVTVLIGEIIDRIEFYHEAEVITPKRQISDDTRKRISAMN
jgi:Fe-S-cluster-containing dehydrogenase component